MTHPNLIENAESFTTDSSPNRMLEQIQASAQAISTLTAEVEELRTAFAKAAEMAGLSQCEACLAHLLESDDYVIDESGCAVCLPCVSDGESGRPCYAYRSLDRTIADATLTKGEGDKP